MELPILLLWPLLLPLLSSVYIVTTTASDATTTIRRQKNATDVRRATPPVRATVEAFTSLNSRDQRSRGVAQYKLPLDPAPTVTVLDGRDGSKDIDSNYNKSRVQMQTQKQTKRRQNQVVMRRRPVSSTSTTTTTTTTSTTTPRPSLANGFNLFNPSFWNFGQQSLVPLRSATPKPPHPPKKFTAVQEKHKQKMVHKPVFRTTTTPTSPTTTTTKPTTTTSPGSTTRLAEGPFRFALPTLTFPSAVAVANPSDKEQDKRAAADLRQRFNCPQEHEVRFQLFPKICRVDKDCAVWNRDELCCDIFGSSSCVAGVAKPLEELAHTPILGLIPRKCPTRPLAELWWDVQECRTDTDCWPRVCCPDGRRRYCRTSQPELETVPIPVKRSFDYLTEYLECTAPPPPIFDLHPKACTSTLDCFPNVCCQEAGLRHCRPPKKSVLTLMANFLNVDFVKRLTQNIVIK